MKRLQWDVAPSKKPYKKPRAVAPAAQAGPPAAYPSPRMYMPQIPYGYPSQGPIQAEFKATDKSASMNCDTTGDVALLNGMAIGTDVDQRVGRTVLMKSLYIRLNGYSTVSTGVRQAHRIVVFYDRQNNGGTPAITDVLKTAHYLSMRNLNNRKRFKIIWDWLLPVSSAVGTAPADLSQYCITKYRKLRHPVEFNDGGGNNAADINTGALFILSLGSVASGSTAGGFNIRARVRYLDA